MTPQIDPAPPHEGRDGPHDDRDRPIGAVAGLIDQVHAIVYVDIPDAAANVGHRTIYLSRGVESVIGYTPAEILDDPDQWLRIVHPDDVGTVIERTIGHLTAPSTLSSEYRVITRDGSVLTVRDDCTSAFDPGLGVIASRGVITDITALRAAERRLETFLERLPITAYTEGPDADEPFRYIGPRIADLTGYDPADFYADARLFARLVHAEDRAKQLAGYGEPGEPYVREYRVWRRDGGIVWVHDEAVVELAGDGSVVAIHGFLLDATAARVAERASAEAERRYRSLVERLPITPYTERGTMDGPFLYIGPQVEAVTGYSAAEFYADEELFQRLVHPDDLDTVLAGYGDPGQPYSVTYRMNRRDGETIWVHDEAVVEHDAERGFDVITGFILDITAEQRANESLAAAESRYRTLVEHLPLVMYIAEVEPTASKDQVVRYVSPQIAGLLGYPPGAFTDDPSFGRSITHPDDVERIYAEWLADPRAPHTMEYRMVAADGRVVWIRDVTASLGDAAGGPELRQGFLLDVTNEREAREALRSAEERYRNLVERLPLVTYIAQIGGDGPADFPSTYVSPQIEGLLGVTPEAFRANPRLWRELVHPDDRDQAFAAYLPGTDREETLEYRMIRADGETIWVRDGSRMIHEPGGSPVLQGYVMDVTEARRADEALVRAQKLESLGNLAGGIAHDFNNLLVSILGNAELALLDLPADAEARGSIEQVEIAARRAADLARQMLAYSGRGQFVVQPLAANELVTEIVDLLRVAIGKGVRLSLRLADDLPAVEADATQLRQVLMNIVVNASDAIGAGEGLITIATERTALDQATIAGLHGTADLAPGDYLAIEISDTGPGMDAGTLRRIFDPFFTTKFAGRGLGLAAVLGIVSGHRGAIAVESQTGRGTRFRIYLPSTSRPIVSDEPASAPSGSRKGTVLVTDDEESVRLVARRMLERFGWLVEEAANGAAALERIAHANGDIDAVLLDLTMPVLDGAGALERLRELRPDLPVVLMSGYTESDVVDRLGRDGPAGFVQKPFTPSELGQALDAAVARARRH